VANKTQVSRHIVASRPHIRRENSGSQHPDQEVKTPVASA
jgi:hypothetical protein